MMLSKKKKSQRTLILFGLLTAGILTLSALVLSNRQLQQAQEQEQLYNRLKEDFHGASGTVHRHSPERLSFTLSRSDVKAKPSSSHQRDNHKKSRNHPTQVKDSVDQHHLSKRIQQQLSSESSNFHSQQLQQIHSTSHKPHHRPSLRTLIRNNETGIIGDVRWLMDFAILGHAKCATSFLMKWLDLHPQVKIWDYEVCDLYDKKPASLVHKLYTELPEGNQYKRGFKCPGHFSRRSLRYFRRYFSKTVLVVGLRHPILWFESFYNFRMRHLERDGKQHLPVPDKLIGECIPEGLGVCTDRGNFHVSLATFGKTNMTDPSERNLLRMRDKYQFISPIDNPVFLYDVAQLYDTNTTRTERFKSDFQHFLGLTKPMPEPKNGTAIRPKKKTIDICQPEFDKVREVLLENGKRASMWIRKYFMQSDQVYVSSRYFFEEALKEWKVDPCLTRTASS